MDVLIDCSVILHVVFNFSILSCNSHYYMYYLLTRAVYILRPLYTPMTVMLLVQNLV